MDSGSLPMDDYESLILTTDVELLKREETVDEFSAGDDLNQHLEESVLSKLPDNYQSIQKQSVISEEDDMVPEPQLDTFVVCRSRGIRLEDGPVDDSQFPFLV
ncbi:hypothetical protein L6164_013682 [Bauhinia variegata]|uniref:Uncharacterized protein n=1 Tax=Bauhinia variegata TaxID=167791 RepID=A0ACB9NEU4_BAUVA|nr:hypothetical protein L6164_013682 [Bauhinia variegata]